MTGLLKKSLVKYWVLFAPKSTFFLTDFPKKWYPNFAVKLDLVSGKWSDWPKNWYTWSLWQLETFCLSDFWYFHFSHFYGTRKMQKSQFFSKICRFCQKMDIFASFASRKIAKNENIKNRFDKKFLIITRIMYTNF